MIELYLQWHNNRKPKSMKNQKTVQ